MDLLNKLKSMLGESTELENTVENTKVADSSKCADCDCGCKDKADCNCANGSCENCKCEKKDE